MKFLCSKDKFLESINIVSKAVSTRSTKPITECILLKTYETGFRLTANNMELGIESSLIDCKIIEDGNICIEAKILIDIIRHLPEDEFIISSDENNVVVITSGKSEFKILGFSGEEFPAIPDVEKSNSYEILANDFKNMIRQTIFSVSLDESKITLTGELFDIKNGELNLVSVDGFRISLRKTKMLNAGSDASIIVPAKAMSEISKILSSDAEEKIIIYTTDKHILFELPTCIVVSRLIDGDFMNYEQVFTNDHTTKIVLSRSKFISCLERSSIISEFKKNPVKLTIEDNKVVVTSQNELGTTYEEVSVDKDGNNLEIGFNPRYLIECLKVIEEDEISIQFTTALSPCIIISESNPDFKYLVLPLRLRS